MSSRRIFGLVVLLALGVAAVLWTREQHGASTSAERAKIENATGVELSGARAPVPAPPAAPPGKPWWLEYDVESLDPAVRRARLEAHWWAQRPAPPYESPDAVFAVEVDLVGKLTRARLTGNDRSGFVVVFLVEAGERSLAYPQLAERVHAVTPGVGSGPIGRDDGPFPILVGSRPLRLRALDADDRPLEGIEVDAKGTEGDSLQRAATDCDGRVLFKGLRDDRVEVSWKVPRSVYSRPERWHGHFGEYADGPARVMDGGDREQVLRVQRNPRVRLRVRVEGAPEDAWCPIVRARLDALEVPQVSAGWTNWADQCAHGLAVPPGRWRCSGWIPGGIGDLLSVETPLLALDTETTLEIPAVAPAGQARLEVAFDVHARPGDAGVVSAVEVRSTDSGIGWSGVQAAAPHGDLFLLASPGRYEVTGAVRTDGVVRFSAPRTVTLSEGERARVVLSTEPAGGLWIPEPPDGAWNADTKLLERDFPATGVIDGDNFRFAWLRNRWNATTWWMPAGSWTVVQLHENGDERERYSLKLEPGKVLRLGRDAKGRLTVPP